MNTYFLIANFLCLLAFCIHTFQGDIEVRLLEPNDKDFNLREKWTMARCGWHWISIDLLLATIGLAWVNFTPTISTKAVFINILLIYFIAYGFAWLLVIFISKPFPHNYLKLGQWGLLWLISGLLYLGS